MCRYNTCDDAVQTDAVDRRSTVSKSGTTKTRARPSVTNEQLDSQTGGEMPSDLLKAESENIFTFWQGISLPANVTNRKVHSRANTAE